MISTTILVIVVSIVLILIMASMCASAERTLKDHFEYKIKEVAREERRKALKDVKNVFEQLGIRVSFYDSFPPTSYYNEFEKIPVTIDRYARLLKYLGIKEVEVEKITKLEKVSTKKNG